MEIYRYNKKKSHNSMTRLKNLKKGWKMPMRNQKLS